MKKNIIAGLLMVTTLPVMAGENPFIESVFESPEKYAGDPPVSGKMIGDNCDACHGTQGRLFDEGIPPLAGIPKETFVKLMMNFKKEKRPTIIMNHVARAFLDDEIVRMGDYFSKQPATPWLDKSSLKGGK